VAGVEMNLEVLPNENVCFVVDLLVGALLILSKEAVEERQYLLFIILLTKLILLRLAKSKNIAKVKPTIMEDFLQQSHSGGLRRSGEV